MRKWFLLVLILFIAPFGTYVQAEPDYGSQTVDQMIKENNKQTSNDENKIERRHVGAEKTENDGFLQEDPPSFDSGFHLFDFVKMFLALAIIIALIYLILRFVHKKNRLFGQMKTMENLGGISLGPNRSIQLVRIGDSIFVIGVGETIQLLKEITSQEEIEKILKQNDLQPLDGMSSLFNNGKRKKAPEEGHGSVNSFRQMLIGQLEELAEGRKKIYEKIKRDHDK